MPFLLGCLALLTPRVVILLVAVFSHYLETAYQTILWPVLGFFFMPTTTLAYAWAVNSGGRNFGGFYVVVMVLAVLIDLGLLGSGSRMRKWRRRGSVIHEIVQTYPSPLPRERAGVRGEG